jgi:hypothetical protein
MINDKSDKLIVIILNEYMWKPRNKKKEEAQSINRETQKSQKQV